MHHSTIKLGKTILCFFTLIALFSSCTNTKTNEEQKIEVAQTAQSNVAHISADESVTDAALAQTNNADVADESDAETALDEATEQPSEVKQLEPVQIKYANTINNYKVSVTWYPEIATCGSSIRGKGNMLFTHTTGAQFEVVHDNFYLIFVQVFY